MHSNVELSAVNARPKLSRGDGWMSLFARILEVGRKKVRINAPSFRLPNFSRSQLNLFFITEFSNETSLALTECGCVNPRAPDRTN
jgi:hypothetical protein